MPVLSKETEKITLVKKVSVIKEVENSNAWW